MISLRTVDGRILAEFRDVARLHSTEGLLGFWNKGAKEFCVNVATEPRLTTRECAYLAGVIREAAMLPYRWVIKTPRKESTHTLEQMIEVALPVEKFRIKYDVSPKFYVRIDSHSLDGGGRRRLDG